MGKNDRHGGTSIGSHVSWCLAEAPHTRSLNNPDGWGISYHQCHGRSFQSPTIQTRMKFWPQRNCWLISRNTWNRQLGNSVLKTCHKQWKRVQHLADVFWSRWRREYLLTLQPRRKWRNMTRNVQKTCRRAKFFSPAKTPQGKTDLSPALPEHKPTVTEWCKGWT